MRILAVALGLAFLLSGCAADRSAGLDTVSLVAVEPGPPDPLVAERPVSASVTWHEEVHRDAKGEAASASDTFTIENEWEPRDVELTYHGVQDVFDEWGRLVPAHVYRYDVMGLEVTEVDLTDITNIQVTARYQAAPHEFAFDAADGRFLGTVLLDDGLRVFSDPRYPDPWAHSYVADLLLPMAFRFLDGELGRPVPGPVGESWLNVTDLKPLDGECTPYEYETRYYPWYEAWIVSMGEPEPTAALPEDEHHHVVCLQHEGIPLWVFSGNSSSNLQLTRLSAPMATPALSGTALAPVVLERHPMEPIPLMLGLATDVEVPPSAYPGDWADLVRPIVQGMGTSLDYLQWQLERSPLYLTDISKAFPHMAGGLLPLVPVNPIPFESTSWVWIADGDDAFWGFVDSRYGGPEDPDLHMGQRGVALDDYPTWHDELVAIGEVQAAWEEQLPIEPDMLWYTGFPDIFDDWPPEMVAWIKRQLVHWMAMEHCFVDEAPGRYGSIAALDGGMLTLGLQATSTGGCSSGSGQGQALQPRLIGGQVAWLLPRTADAPAILVLPDAGRAFALGHGLDTAALADALLG